MISFADPGSSHGLLTLEEAAVLAGVKEKFVRKTLETALRRPMKKHGRRRFGARDVLALRVLGSLPFRIAPKETKDALRLLTENREESGVWARRGETMVMRGDLPVEVGIGQVQAEVARRVRVFRECSRGLVVSADLLGGEPVFAGTRVPVRHVGALVLRGEPVERLREDFPRLTTDQLEFAGWFTQLGRPPGRPRKKLKLFRSPR